MISHNNKINYLATGIFGIKYFRNLRRKDLQGVVGHIQLNVQKDGEEEGKNYLVAGRFGHSELLEKSLHRLGLSYETEEFEEEQIPKRKGDEYFVFGAGHILQAEDPFGMIFSGDSSFYEGLSTNGEDLRKKFGEESYAKLKDSYFPSFLVCAELGGSK